MVVGRASSDEINVETDDEQEGSTMLPPYYNNSNGATHSRRENKLNGDHVKASLNSDSESIASKSTLEEEKDLTDDCDTTCSKEDGEIKDSEV